MTSIHKAVSASSNLTPWKSNNIILGVLPGGLCPDSDSDSDTETVIHIPVSPSRFEEKPSSATHIPHFHDILFVMFENRLHVPLSLFTHASTKRLRDLQIKGQAKLVVFGYDTYALDCREFPDELSMDIVDWYDAWTRYKLFLKEVCSPEVLALWDEYHLHLALQADLRANFDIILSFDVAFRSRWIMKPFKITPSIVQDQLSSHRMRAFLRDLIAVPPASSHRHRSKNERPNMRNHPYRNGDRHAYQEPLPCQYSRSSTPPNLSPVDEAAASVRDWATMSRNARRRHTRKANRQRRLAEMANPTNT